MMWKVIFLKQTKHIPSTYHWSIFHLNCDLIASVGSGWGFCNNIHTTFIYIGFEFILYTIDLRFLYCNLTTDLCVVKGFGFF